MGVFLNEIKKALEKLNKKRSDIPSLTSNKFKPGNVSALFRGTVPISKKTVSLLAGALKIDDYKLRVAAAKNKITDILKRYDVTWGDISKGAGQGVYKLPVFEVNALPLALSKKGHPIASTDRYINVATTEYGPYSYGLLVNDVLLSPRLEPGEIAILSAEYKATRMDEYGVVGSSEGIFIGRIQDQTSHINIEQMKPHYNVARLPKKQVFYIHRIVGMHRPK